MYTDPIADMLTRIRNAQMVKKSEVILPFSKLKFNIARLLETEGWIGKVEELAPQEILKVKANNTNEKNARFKQIKIRLLYTDNKPKIEVIKRISKPGRRIYAGKDEMPIVLNHYGIAVISTPKGLMTNKQAKQKGVGGEIICEIY